MSTNFIFPGIEKTRINGWNQFIGLESKAGGGKTIAMCRIIHTVLTQTRPPEGSSGCIHVMAKNTKEVSRVVATMLNQSQSTNNQKSDKEILAATLIETGWSLELKDHDDFNSMITGMCDVVNLEVENPFKHFFIDDAYLYVLNGEVNTDLKEEVLRAMWQIIPKYIQGHAVMTIPQYNPGDVYKPHVKYNCPEIARYQVEAHYHGVFVSTMVSDGDDEDEEDDYAACRVDWVPPPPVPNESGRFG